MAHGCTLLADSINPDGKRIISLTVNMPKCLVAQFNTHRMFSRNSASSRAIPVSKMIQRVREDPFIPDVWGANQKGMQAGSTVDDVEAVSADSLWRSALNSALEYAEALDKLGIHKQLANRLLEPFAWTTVLVTATEWDNFFSLRLHHATQPEMQRVAQTMHDAIQASTPVLKAWGEWHYPYPDRIPPGYPEADARLVMAARCARLSYLTHDGKQSLEDDLRLGKQLWEDRHLSPFEHSAYAAILDQDTHNLRGWRSHRACLESEASYHYA